MKVHKNLQKLAHVGEVDDDLRQGNEGVWASPHVQPVDRGRQTRLWTFLW